MGKAAPVPAPVAGRRPIAELQPGEHVNDQIYLVQDKDLRTTSNGSSYIHAILADGSGRLVARMWDATKALFDGMPTGGFMRFRGRVETYKDKPQFIIDGMRTAEPGSFDPTDFLPHTPYDVETMWTRVKEILRSIKNADLLALVARFVNDREFVAAFKQAPAAAALHHAYLGGLLEHTLNLMELAVLIVPRYQELSLDLMLAAIFLHDAGKTRELTYGSSFGYSDEGQLVGHLVMCVTWLDQRAREVAQETGKPFPADVLNVLKHLVLSHHGQYEYGSPKLPALPEAFVLHYLDNLDAKLATCRAQINANRDDASDWTGYIQALGTKLYKPDVTRPPDAAP